MRPWYFPGILALLLQSCHQPEQVSGTAASHQARYILGMAAPWEAKNYSATDELRFKMDFGFRRQMGWDTAARILKPVPTRLGQGRKVPAFLTWYGKDDLRRMFHRLYSSLTPAQRALRSDFMPESLQSVGHWNAHYTRSLPGWPEERLTEWLASHDTAERAHSLGGLGRTYYNRAAAQHILKNYRMIADCNQLMAGILPTHKGRRPDNFSLCLEDEFPDDSVIVKTSWRRTDFGINIPSYDTSAAGLAIQFHNESGWDQGASWHQPENSSLFAMETAGGDQFRLTGLHIMTKELREWLWISLWWSPERSSPMKQDQPADSAQGSNFPLSSYSMCVVTSYTEQAKAQSPYLHNNPELGEAFAFLSRAGEGYSWCSNPYLEKGPGNQRSNCIGCHQNGGSGSSIPDILQGEEDFPASGKARARLNFPTDYLWSLTRDPENISAVFSGIMNHFEVSDNLH